MIVDYIQKKLIDQSRINTILKNSIDSNHFSNNGPAKQNLEKLLHSKLNIELDKSVVCLSSGTSACHALIYMYERLKNKKLKWIVPSYTFPSPAISNCNIEIVDIELKTYTISTVSDKLKDCDGIIITNLFGTCNQVEEFVELCSKTNKVLIFDNASSPLTSIGGRNICNFGNSSFGSLHHTKYLGFGEGGFVVIPSEHCNLINQIANFGFDYNRRYSLPSSNFKMSDISAAYCHMQLENYNIEKHILVQNDILAKLNKINAIVMNIDKENVNFVLGNIPLIFDDSIDTAVYRTIGIEANKYYCPLKKSKNSNSVFSRIINLPLHSDLTEYQINYMCDVTNELINEK